MPQARQDKDFSIIDVDVVNDTDNVTDNVINNNHNDVISEFPCSRNAAANALGTTAMTLGRWVKTFEKHGHKITQDAKISQSGFVALTALKNAIDNGKTPLAYIQSLTPSNAHSDAPSGALAVTEKDKVSMLTTNASVSVTELKAQFLELIDREKQEQEFQQKIAAMRKAKLMKRAMAEFLEEEKAIAEMKRELRMAQIEMEMEE